MGKRTKIRFYVGIIIALIGLVGTGCARNKNIVDDKFDMSESADVSVKDNHIISTRENQNSGQTKKQSQVAEKSAENTVGKTTGEELKDSGITVCIDPGHYTNCNVLYFEDGTSYCEGDVTLQVAQKLQQILEEKYKIHSYLTRTGGSITIDGLTDETLDSAYIHLRGEQAAGADLFVSIHTNANQDNANGYPTCEQPVALNKPILLANMLAKEDETALKIGNAIGKNIAKLYQQLNLSDGHAFEENMNGATLREWSDAYNDDMNVPGTICTRTDGYADYYGVLRGASNVGVCGYIIEHGFHTVPEVRKQVKDGDLVTRWAEADAKGIAEGFGVIETKE